MILISAFKPFGLIRGTLMGKNSSLEVLEKIRAVSPANFNYLVLDVNDTGILQLRRKLQELRPSGVMCLGELAALSGKQVKLEPFAVKSRPSIFPLLSISPSEKELSPFAQAHIPADSGSTIGRYFCNAAYLAALQWAQSTSGNQPVGFVHVPVLGERDEHAAQVRKILWQMQNY